VQVFHFATLNCCIRIRVQLEEKGHYWMDREMDIRSQRNLPPEYFDMHP
jgi:hypothetical protein